MVAERPDEQVGSVADEVARLVASLRRATDSPDGDAPTDSDAPGPGGSDSTPPRHDPVCQWCPVCRSVAAVRQVSPETLSRLADLAAFAAAVLTDLAGQRTESRTTGSPAATDVDDGEPRRG